MPILKDYKNEIPNSGREVLRELFVSLKKKAAQCGQPQCHDASMYYLIISKLLFTKQLMLLL
jgi:hypothetical protein